MSEEKERIGELYYLSKSVDFGAFRLSVHNDQPDLPLSPWYLHYPDPDSGKPGTEFLPELYELVGHEFYNILESQSPPIRPRRIAGVPKGALPLALAHAKMYDSYPDNLLKFSKVQHKDGRTEFTGPEGMFEENDELVIDEDHTSGGRNKKLIRAAAMTQGLLVNTMLTVVDRQQGGVENMSAVGVRLLSIFTADQLLQLGVDAGFIPQATMDKVQEYRQQNQF